MAKQPRVWSGTQWEPLAVTLPDLSNYSTTTQIAATYSPISTTGLVLVSSQNLSTSSGISFTSLTVGKRYRIVSSLIGSSNGINLGFRFRENSTDKATAYYGGGFRADYTGGTGTYTLNNNSRVWLTYTTTTVPNVLSADIYLTSASNAFMQGQFHDSYNGNNYYFSAYNTGSMSNVNGISIYPESGTFTGIVSLYQYL